MDALIAVFEQSQVRLLVAVVLVVIALALIFRRQIGELIGRTKGIEIGPRKRRWKVEFAQRVQHEEKRAAAIPRQIPAGLSAPAGGLAGVAQTGREMVLEAWGAVKQAVYDGGIANGLPMKSSLDVAEAMRRLRDARGLGVELVELIDVVDELGREVAADRGLRPEDEDAEAYRRLAYRAVSWLGSIVLVPAGKPVSEGRRPTVVAGNVVPPSPGRASVALIATAGPMKGQQYPVDKAVYQLGRSAGNDLRVAADDSISGNHASLRYEKGGLFLSDQGSLNGTFLNDQRVTGAPVMVRHGDRIRLGESVFEVVGIPAGASGPGPQGRSVVY